MTEAVGAGDGGAAAAAAAAAAAGAVKPWHDGVEAEYIGHWQNRGLKLDDAKTIAIDMTKAHREAVSKLGVPPEQLVRIPKADAPEAEVKAYWGRIGVPLEAKDYDLSAVKLSDGKDLDAAFADTLRDALLNGRVPKDRAGEVAGRLVKFEEAKAAAAASERTAKLEVERAQLKADWKQDYDGNLYVAKQGAKALGLTPEQVGELEGLIGYKAIMTAMHRVGSLGKEASFITGGGDNKGAMTREQAHARKADLMADKAWQGRYLGGDTAARTEMLNLNRIITGDFESAA